MSYPAVLLHRLKIVGRVGNPPYKTGYSHSIVAGGLLLTS